MEPTKKEIREGYDKIADKIGSPQKFYKAVLKFAGGIKGNVVDLGCGKGLLLEVLEQKYPNTSFIGCDLSGVLALKAKKRNPRSKIFQGDLEVIPIKSGVIDFVFVTEVLEHLLHVKESLFEIFRILRPGGKLMITVPNRDWICFDSYMENRTPYQPIDDYWFTKKELENLLFAAGFRVMKIGGAETLGQKSGLPLFFERIKRIFNSSLSQKMKRLLILASKD